jgi:hypothetical protein
MLLARAAPARAAMSRAAAAAPCAPRPLSRTGPPPPRRFAAPSPAASYRRYLSARCAAASGGVGAGGEALPAEGAPSAPQETGAGAANEAAAALSIGEAFLCNEESLNRLVALLSSGDAAVAVAASRAVSALAERELKSGDATTACEALKRSEIFPALVGLLTSADAAAAAAAAEAAGHLLESCSGFKGSDLLAAVLSSLLVIRTEAEAEAEAEAEDEAAGGSGKEEAEAGGGGSGKKKETEVQVAFHRRRGSSRAYVEAGMLPPLMRLLDTRQPYFTCAAAIDAMDMLIHLMYCKLRKTVVERWYACCRRARARAAAAGSRQGRRAVAPSQRKTPVRSARSTTWQRWWSWWWV